MSIVDIKEGKLEQEMVTISKDKYDSLKRDSAFLSCLEACGVDNWMGFDMALDLMGEDEE